MPQCSRLWWLWTFVELEVSAITILCKFTFEQSPRPNVLLLEIVCPPVVDDATVFGLLATRELCGGHLSRDAVSDLARAANMTTSALAATIAASDALRMWFRCFMVSALLAYTGP